jgi:hypothetical protein
MQPIENPSGDGSNDKYINTTVYKDVADKLVKIVGNIGDMMVVNNVSRALRYTTVDVETERASGKIAADELLIFQHIVDTNIRREQSSYVQYYTQSPRAVILENPDKPESDNTILENDITNRLRFPEWQISMFATTDGMQQNGYGCMEVVYDINQPGNLRHEAVGFGDFGFYADTRNIQDTEFLGRAYYFSKTKLLEMCVASDKNPDPFLLEYVTKVVETAPKDSAGGSPTTTTSVDRSLYRIFKFMFRVNGIVHVGWALPEVCDEWLRPPRPLFLGRRSDPMPVQQPMVVPPMPVPGLPQPPQGPQTTEVYETQYPYIIFPYLISENNIIQQLKGRVYLDQDTQQAATSLMSSFCTGHRRAAKLLFGVDGDDPNAALNTSVNSPLQTVNINFKDGAIIKQKVKQFKIDAPDSSMVNAINLIVSANQNETSQVNFAVQNRQDSRKTATEVNAAQQEASKLSTVQVVLFSNSLRNLYSLMFGIIQSRVRAGLIEISNPEVLAMYNNKYIVKPAGDVDVIERQNIVQTQIQAWPIVAQTPIAGEFFLDMMSGMFPQNAAKYIQIFKNFQQQQAMQQQQAQQQGAGVAKQIGAGLIKLSESPEMFSEMGKVNALPKVKEAAEMIKQMMGANQPQK